MLFARHGRPRCTRIQLITAENPPADRVYGSKRLIVTNDQEMIPEFPMPRRLAAIAKGIFRLNHYWAMSRAQRALEQLANAGADDALAAMYPKGWAA